MSTLALFVWTVGDLVGVIIWGLILLFVLFILVCYVLGAVCGWLGSPKRWWNRLKP